jgi:hypothetical protein
MLALVTEKIHCAVRFFELRLLWLRLHRWSITRDDCSGVSPLKRGRAFVLRIEPCCARLDPFGLQYPDAFAPTGRCCALRLLGWRRLRRRDMGGRAPHW